MESGIIIMTATEAERLTIINNLIAKKINGTDAAKQLHLSVRQTKRLKARVIQKGATGASLMLSVARKETTGCRRSFSHKQRPSS